MASNDEPFIAEYDHGIWSQLDQGGGAGYARIAMFGGAGAGKTFTASDLAVKIRRHFKLGGPIVMADTEGGSLYTREWVDRNCDGQRMRVLRSRFISQWCQAIDAAVENRASVFVGDSVTHVWSHLCDAFLEQKQENADRRGWQIPDKLEFQDWAPIKKEWSTLTERFLNAPIHQIFCGRQGHHYEFSFDEKGKKSLDKGDVKMRAEGQFEHESSLSLHMSLERATADTPPVIRVMCRKDRFDRLMLQTCDIRPGTQHPGDVFEFIRPHIEMLDAESNRTTDTRTATDFDIGKYGTDNRTRSKRERTIVVEEIKAELLKLYPKQTTDDKTARSDAMGKHFKTRSWTKVETEVSLVELRQGLAALQEPPAEPKP